MLTSLVAHLHESIGISHKQDIQMAASSLKQNMSRTKDNVQIGDDCAAIPDTDGYLLLACEGMMPFFVAHDPWFAGWSAIMVNVNDIYAMGGRPIGVVDALWSQSIEHSELLWAGMQAASLSFNVPIIGGHTNCHSPYNALCVSILGRARRLITSFDAQPGQQLLMVVDFDGKMHPKFPFWNAATETPSAQLQRNLSLLPHIAETNLCHAGKDISMGGIIGTALMLLETSGKGATLNIDAIPCPKGVPLATWLTTFPSFGFLLSVAPSQVPIVQDLFHNHQIICEVIGEVNSSLELVLQFQQESISFWNLNERPLTGFKNFSLE
ncbi:MAG: sll0787 family AIR synthase-like protein [Oscillatoriales cyanobacterium SM2_2_1]|nr:sll0787 family AIR synthase-like protein [Oscillatoriales cyanobacterium SM2_2_1]